MPFAPVFPLKQSAPSLLRQEFSQPQVSRYLTSIDLITGQLDNLKGVSNLPASLHGISQPSSLCAPLKQQIHDVGDRKAFLLKRGLLQLGDGVIKVSLQKEVKKEQLRKISNSQLFQLNKMHCTPLSMPSNQPGGPIKTQRVIDVVPVALPSVDAPHTIDIDSYISNRVSSGLIDACKYSRCDFFCAGNEQDLLSHYGNTGFSQAYAISSNTSTKNYLLINQETGERRIVMSNMTSVARVRHQLLKLHFSGIDIKNIDMVGSVYDLKQDASNRLSRTLSNLPDSDAKILYIGSRWKVMESISRHVNKLESSTSESEAYDKLQPCTYNIGSYLFDVATIDHHGRKLQIAALRMPNGDLSQDAVEAFISNGYTHIIMCGAGGQILGSSGIGDYVLLNSSQHENQTLALGDELITPAPLDTFISGKATSNTTVDSPLAETKEWLSDNITKRVGTVDVETAHIFKALLKHEGPLSVTAGMFISDIVGAHPLDEKISADAAYKNLDRFVNITLRGAIERDKLTAEQG